MYMSCDDTGYKRQLMYDFELDLLILVSRFNVNFTFLTLTCFFQF